MNTITDGQIEQLRTEAGQAGDHLLQVAICDVALATGLSEIDEDLRSDLESLGIIPEHVDVRARAECARVIAAAAAQEGGAR